MYVRQTGTGALVLTPAKVNLSLEVLSRRSDGFHEIETLMAAVTIFDTLELTPTESGEVRLVCRWAAGLSARAAAQLRGESAGDSLPLGDLPAGPENLVWRAATRLRERAGIALGAEIQLTKRIPAAGGLGGASSDAAAALVAANTAWRLGWPRESLAEVAAEIGSDVPFFLGGGAAVCRGRGERIEPIRIPRLYLVIVRPPMGLSTPQVYQGCRPAAAPIESGPLVTALARGQVAVAARMLNNRLEEPATRLTPWVARLRQELSQQGVLGCQMSGSGSSYFGICSHARHARRVAARLRARRLGTVFAAMAAGSHI